MKGKTIIELKDKSGHVDRYVDHNMLTNALSYFMKQGGMTNPTAFNVSDIRTNAIEMLLGGVLLLDDTITEDVANVRVPAGIEMVANGAVNVTNSDVPTELGSYNSVESGWQQDGTLKMVWDWTTSQGNGTIKSVCLTSKYMGLRGLGNADGRASNSLTMGSYNSINSYSGYSGSAIGMTGNTLITVESIGDGVSSDVTGIILRKYRAPYTTLDIRDKLNSPQLISETTITYPNAIPKSNASRWECYTYYAMDNNFLYILYNRHYSTSWSNAHTIIWTDSVPLWLRKINLSNGAVTEHDITPTEVGLSGYNEVHCPIGISPTHVYADRHEISMSSFILTNSVESYYETNDYFRVYYKGVEHIWEARDDNKGVFLLDFVNPSVKPINISTGQYEYGFYNELSPLIVSDGAGVYRDPRYIATINNLSAPVVKTGDKTMKVTYILSF